MDGLEQVRATIRADLEAIGQAASLCEERSFVSRADALDFLEFHVLDRIDGLLQDGHPAAALHDLKQAGEQLKAQLEAVDTRLFQRLQASIRSGACRGEALRGLIEEYTEGAAAGRELLPEIGYDSLDTFTNGLLPGQELPAETREREPEMVFYQKTPARIILELAAKAALTREDVFYDIGSGLGQVPILVHLLSGAPARGIEFEGAYCAYARACAEGLNLPGVAFLHADARTADYSGGTVFFLYTPFAGRVLQQVLDRLREEARRRMIRVFTYGPCTVQVARACWLRWVGEEVPDGYRLGTFISR